MPDANTIETPETPNEDAATATAEMGGETGLGEAGLAALKAEREAAKAARKQAAELEAQLVALRDAGKSEVQKLADQVAAMKSDLEAERARSARLAAAQEAGVPVDLLDGPGEDPAAYAKRLADWKNTQDAQSEPAKKQTGSPVPAVKERPASGAVTLDDQIAAAITAGDTKLAATLKACKLGKVL
ncbi:hypothetical protein V3M78_06625 [Trueperella pyogenes]|uniref:hypothetical protein n=1 Tax=Trueperella pyogenes TaxID=1661 RepID=UPI00345D1F2A